MENKTNQVLKDVIPQHNTFDFDTICFSSLFDSGNLAKVEKVSERQYNLWTAPDCAGTTLETKNRSWFYFHVNTHPYVQITFTLKNMNLQGKLYREGLRPFYRNDNDEKWYRTTGPCNWAVTGDVASQFEVTFTHEFSTGSVYFAFCFPWSYSEHQNLWDELESTHGNRKDLYFYRENLMNSLEGRRLDVLTISGRNRMSQERESPIEGLYPNGGQRAFQFDKPIAFITARVHCGETPASFVCNGLLKFLLSSDPRAQLLLNEFVFKIIPMINPDGVYRGFYRGDTKGQNLNRVYLNCTPEKSPTVWAIKQLVDYHASKIFFYIDLHAHASKKGTFVFGNQYDYLKCNEGFHFAKLMEMNCCNFDLDVCSFNDRNMGTKEGREAKEGCSRAAFGKLHGFTRIYTLECNYNRGKVVNDVLQIELPESNLSNPSYELYSNGAPPYTIEIFENIGSAICVSLLDVVEKNPFSRVFKSSYGTHEEFKLESAHQLVQRAPFRRVHMLKRFKSDKKALQKYLIYKENQEKKVTEENKQRKPGRRPRSRSKTERGDSVPARKPPVPTAAESVALRNSQINNQALYRRPPRRGKPIYRSLSNKARNLRKPPLASSKDAFIVV